QLAVYGFGSAKLQEADARELTLKAINLPPSLKHLEQQYQGSSEKKFVFSDEFLEQYYDETFKQKLTTQATNKNKLNNKSNNINGNGGRGRRGKSRPFRGRGRGAELQQQQNTISTPTTTTNPATPTSNAGSNIHQLSPSTTNIYLNPAELFRPGGWNLPGGRLSHFFNNWKKITTHSWPLSVIRDGYQLQWATKPAPWKIKKMQHSPSDQQAVDAAIDKFLKAGIIYRSPTQDRSYLSNFFTIQEPTKRRPILDCTRLNQHLQVQHFKMEGIPAL
ncbi:hypothetical protein, partial, partial [Parasitella parasitica]